jgi:hypothetical protein
LLASSYNSRDVAVSTLIETTTLERTGCVFGSLVGLLVSDRAALGVAKALNMDEIEGCLMHDGQKVAEAATGKLTRSPNKIVVNPFKEGAALLARAHKMAVHFSWGSRRKKLEVIIKKLGGVPNITLKLDLNDTRIAAEHGLLISSLRLHRARMTYKLENPSAFFVFEGDWPAWTEFEAVLNTSQVLTKVAQYEVLYMAAYGPVVKLMFYSWLCADSNIH